MLGFEFLNDPITVFTIAVVGTMLVTLYGVLRMYQTFGAVRRQNRRAQRLTEDVRREWESFNRNQSEQIRQELQAFEERAGKLEELTQRRIAEFEQLVGTLREELSSLERYLREVLEVELKNAFDSFDSTVGSVLSTMKDELLRGVERIEQIESVIDQRLDAQTRLAEGAGEVRRLTGGAETNAAHAETNAVEDAEDTSSGKADA